MADQSCLHSLAHTIRLMYIYISMIHDSLNSTWWERRKKQHTFSLLSSLFLRLTSIFVEAVKDIKINTRTVKRVPSLVVFARCAHERIVKFFSSSPITEEAKSGGKKDDMSAVVQRIFSAAAEKATRQIVKFNYFHSTVSPARLQLNSNRRAAETWSGSFFFVCDELARDLGPHSLSRQCCNYTQPRSSIDRGIMYCLLGHYYYYLD